MRCAVTIYYIGKSCTGYGFNLSCFIREVKLACFDGKLALVLACKCFELRF